MMKRRVTKRMGKKINERRKSLSERQWDNVPGDFSGTSTPSLGLRFDPDHH